MVFLPGWSSKKLNATEPPKDEGILLPPTWAAGISEGSVYSAYNGWHDEKTSSHKTQMGPSTATCGYSTQSASEQQKESSTVQQLWQQWSTIAVMSPTISITVSACHTHPFLARTSRGRAKGWTGHWWRWGRNVSRKTSSTHQKTADGLARSIM